MTHALVSVESTTSGPNSYRLGNEDLPVAQHRAEIEDSLTNNVVTLIESQTGSGKSTQLVQIAIEMGLFDQIDITQPRRLAARSVSERVAQEIAASDEDDLVGYTTGHESSETPQYMHDATFITDGKAAIQHLKQNRNKHKKKLLVIDEAHEWNQSIELLVAVAAERTNPASPQYDPNLKVVIMSATMDGKGLQKHFAHTAAPLISIDSRNYEVTRSVTNESVEKVALREASEKQGKVLAIVAGKAEIQNIIDDDKYKSRAYIPRIPLHSQQTPEEQDKALAPREGASVVAATNVVQTSITVPDALVVVDSGEARQSNTDYNHVPSGSKVLELIATSKADTDQRAGRVGRTQPGQHILASPDGRRKPIPYEERQDFATPAIERDPLDSMLLLVKSAGYEMGDFNFFHKPPVQALEAAEKRLITLGAIDRFGKVTARGEFMATLPLDPDLACMVAFAYEREYSDDVKRNLLDMAAIMQAGGIVKRSPKDLRWQDLLLSNADGSLKENESDFIVQLDVYIALAEGVISRKQWPKFDILEYNAESVEDVRENLATRLQLELEPVAAIAPGDRQSVLTAINAGQLNQLWERHGEQWSLVLDGHKPFDSNESFDLAKSSVIAGLGKYATGTLFRLGLGHDDIIMLQDANRVPNLQTLEQSAEHLVVKEVVPGSVLIDPENGRSYERVAYRLGNIVLRVGEQETDADTELTALQAFEQEFYKKRLNEANQDRNEPPRPYDSIVAIDVALQEPVKKCIGVNPATGEELYAFKGGKGQWCASEGIALDSLMARRDRILNASHESTLRAEKVEVQDMCTKLVEIKRQGGADPREVKKHINMLRSRKIPRSEALELAQVFVQSIRPSK